MLAAETQGRASTTFIVGGEKVFSFLRKNILSYHSQITIIFLLAKVHTAIKIPAIWQVQFVIGFYAVKNFFQQKWI